MIDIYNFNVPYYILFIQASWFFYLINGFLSYLSKIEILFIALAIGYTD